MEMDIEGEEGQITLDYEMVNFENLVDLFENGTYFQDLANSQKEPETSLSMFGSLCILYYLENIQESDNDLFLRLCKCAGESVEVGGVEVDTSEVEDLTVEEFGQYCIDRFYRQIDYGYRCHMCHKIVDTENLDCVSYGLCDEHLDEIEL